MLFGFWGQTPAGLCPLDQWRRSCGGPDPLTFCQCGVQMCTDTPLLVPCCYTWPVIHSSGFCPDPPDSPREGREERIEGKAGMDPPRFIADRRHCPGPRWGTSVPQTPSTLPLPNLTPGDAIDSPLFLNFWIRH